MLLGEENLDWEEGGSFCPPYLTSYLPSCL